MDIFAIYNRQLKLAKEQFSHIVEDGEVIHTPGGLPQKLRLKIIDGSVVDVFLSARGRYSYHWERRYIDGTLYRHDNAPHKRWRHIKIFPKHFHNGSEADEDGCLKHNQYFLAVIHELRELRQASPVGEHTLFLTVVLTPELACWPFRSCTDLPTQGSSPPTPKCRRDKPREQLLSISVVNVRDLVI